MASVPDLDAASSLGRSSSIDARDGALPRSESQRRSASRVGRKGGRSGNDLFVCFAPRTTLNLVSANRPVVSPARDKGKETGSARRSSRNLSASIFSSKAPSKKQGYDDAVDEPTSPKVTCIGQVRSKSKNDKRHKGSPAAPRRQGSSGHAEGKKESACSSFAKDFSCFGLPCDSYGSLPSFRGDKKSSGTVFAKSLVLIQKEDEGKKTVAMEASATAKLRTHNFSEDKGGGEASATAQPAWKEAAEDHSEISSFLQETPSLLDVPGLNDKPAEDLQRKDIAEDHTCVKDDDTFEEEPPPPNALLLMRNKVDHLRVLVPPPSTNITLKRSTSAPAHCRRKSEDGDDNGQVMPAPEQADHSSITLEKRSDTSSVFISSEDLPKPNWNASKSFLQRCKSVSRSLSRSTSEQQAVETRPSPVPQQQAKVIGQNGCETSILEERRDELHLVSEALSRRRSDSEALKVSLDIVPETWMWEARAVAKQESKEATGSGRRPEMKQAGGTGAEWLDGDLEAALWKSCQVADPVRAGRSSCTHSEALRVRETALPDSLGGERECSANQALDAEIEATLWRCCSLVASHSSQDLPSGATTGSDDVGLRTVESDPTNRSSIEMLPQREANCEKAEENATIQDNSASMPSSNATHTSNLGRSCSVGSQDGKHLLNRGSSLRRSASVGAGQHYSEQQERARNNKISTEQARKGRMIYKAQSPHEVSDQGQARIRPLDDDTHASIATLESNKTTCLKAEIWHHHNSGDATDIKQNDESEDAKNTSEEEIMDAEDISAPSPSSVLYRPAPPPSPAPATPPEAVLFVRYDLGAFAISLDAPANMDAQAVADHHNQQQKAMLEAISQLDIHNVQRTYTRLLKAASGKERASLSSAAFRLQRCKSEPVRLASY